MRRPVPFGKYLLLERISVGGMAEVFKAKSFGVGGFQKILAIKRILPSMAEDEDFITMFIDEAKIAGQLTHANICQIYELGRIDSSHFIAMEYIWGKDVLQLQNRFRRMRRRMPLPMAAYIAAQVCEGLDYAHKKRDTEGNSLDIIHRDVSPQNVLVSYEGEVKIIDFGIAKAVSRSSKTQAGVLKGKFGYMSPEQVRGNPLDQRSDIFAIGTLLWEMCTGERLFTGESDFAILDKVRNADVPLPTSRNPSIDAQLESIVMRALRRNADDRYLWANDMQDELQAYLMQQQPAFSSKNLAHALKQMFQRELERERTALERYKSIAEGEIAKVPSVGRREMAVSLLGRDSGRPLPPDPSPTGPARESKPAKPPAVPLPPDKIATVPTPSVEPVPPEHLQQELDALDSDAADFDDGATEVGGPSFFPGGAPGEAEGQGGAEGGASREEFDDGATHVYAGQSPAPDDPPMAAQPTFIFNTETGELEAAEHDLPVAEQSTVIFANTQGGNGSAGAEAEGPPQGPTVIFSVPEGGARAAAAKGAAADQAPPSADGAISATTTVPPAPRRSSLLKDVLIGMLAAAVLLAGGFVLWRYVLRAPETATLVVTAGHGMRAEALVDGTSRGKVVPGRPLTLKGVAVGDHRVALLPAGGGDPLVKNVSLVAGDVKVVQIGGGQAGGGAVHEPAAKEQPPDAAAEVDSGAAASKSVGSARIESSPSGATVLIDGKRRGVTPLSIDSIAPGRYRVTLELEGHRRKRGWLEVNAGERAKVALELPGGSRHARRRHKTAANTSESSDKRSARASSSGTSKNNKRDRRSDKSEKQSGKARRPPRKRARRGKSGYLVANTVPWARVLVDGKSTGKTTPIPPRSKISLSPGRHKVTFVVDGKRFTYKVRVKPGEISRLIKKLPVK